MRRKLLLALVAIVFGGLASVGIGARAAHAAPSYYAWIWLGSDGATCVQENGGGVSGTALVTGPCGNSGTYWGPSADSYGPSWSSIVDQNHAHGTMCLDDVGAGTDGVQLQIRGCNGSAEQAWRLTCDNYSDPAIMDGYGQVVDLYGDHDDYGVKVVGWHLYPINGGQSLPDAEIWEGPWEPYGNC